MGRFCCGQTWQRRETDWVPTMYGESVTLICDILPSLRHNGLECSGSLTAIEGADNGQTRQSTVRAWEITINISDLSSRNWRPTLVVDRLALTTPYLSTV